MKIPLCAEASAKAVSCVGCAFQDNLSFEMTNKKVNFFVDKILYIGICPEVRKMRIYYFLTFFKMLDGLNGTTPADSLGELVEERPKGTGEEDSFDGLVHTEEDAGGLKTVEPVADTFDNLVATEIEATTEKVEKAAA